MFVVIFFQVICVGSIYGGVIKGNGGNTLVCGESVEVLDISEARLLYSANFNFVDLEARAFTRAEKQISPVVYRKLHQWLKTWRDEAQFLNNVSLGEVTDSFHFVIPKDCMVVQTVIAREPLPGEKRYLVQADIYERLKPWQKLALQWHEVLYRQVIERRQSHNFRPDDIYNSESTRRMVANLFSDESETLTSVQWTNLFSDLN